MKVFFSSIFFLCTVSLFADHAGDTSEITRLNSKAREILLSNTDSSILIAEQALVLAEKVNYYNGITESLIIIGLAYRENVKFAEAESSFKKALDIAERKNLELPKANALGHLGMLNEKTGNYRAALGYMLASLTIRKKINDEKGIGKMLNNIALVFAEQGNYEKAIYYYRTSIESKLKTGDTALTGKNYNNIGITLISMKRYDEAIVELNKALEINKKYGLKEEQATNIGNLGLAYDNKGDKKKARDYYMRCIEMGMLLGIKDERLSIPINNLGTIYLEENKLADAEKLFKRSLELSSNMGSKEDMREAYGNLAQVFAKGKKFELAYENQQEFNALTDTLAHEKSNKAIAEMMVKFDTERKESENKLLVQQNELQKLKLSQSNYIIYGLAVLIILVIALSVLFFRHKKLKTGQEKILLEQRLLRAQMNPHFVFNAVNSIQSQILQKKQHDAYHYLTRFSQLIRTILNNSNEEYISLKKEIEAISIYMELEQLRFEENFEYTYFIDASIDAEDILVPPMIIQPFLENAIWHGLMPMNGLRKAKLHLNITKNADGKIHIVIQDNGIGMEESKKIKREISHTSMGIRLIRQRLELLGKSADAVSITSLADENNNKSGTKVELWI